MKVSAWASVLFRKSKVISLRLVEVFLREGFKIPLPSSKFEENSSLFILWEES